METLVATVNLLQDVFSASDCAGVNLPQIVVVGTQSSGKSSVLEHLVGRSFLPRGTGIVTRCPLVLQLSPTAKEVARDWYAIFQHDKTKVFTDCQLIQKEIENQTKKLAGSNKGICKTPITLKIYSPSLPCLTLVDLPGLTKVPVGDQPHDVEHQARRLILEYVMNPDSLILAVVPANADMATSESLKVAKEVDPEGSRTLAVVTKLDLMDEGTDAREMLTGKIIPVKLGIIGVVNRSQKDIQDEKSIAKSLQDEAEFFKTHYGSISDYHGCTFLKKKVQSLLVSHIRNCMPKLREAVDQKLAIKRAELQKLGSNKLDKPSLLLSLINKFSNTFVSAVNGNFSNIQTKELNGGARIRYVFQECFSNFLEKIDPLAGLSQVDIMTAMENVSGVSTTIFMPEGAFGLLIKTQIERLRVPCLKCVDLVYEELIRIIQNCLGDSHLEFSSFPKLQREMEDVVTDILQSRLPVTRKFMEDFINIQLAYINTSHPDFLPNKVQAFTPVDVRGDRYEPNVRSALVARKASMAQERTCEPPSQDKATRDYTMIQELIISYFSIVRKVVQDTVPKGIMHLLVNFAIEHLTVELVGRLYKSDAEDILQESRVITDRRRELKKEVAQLEKATDIIKTLSPTKMRV